MWRGGPLRGSTSFLAVRALHDNVIAATINSVVVSKERRRKLEKAAVPAYVTAIYAAAITPDALWIATREGALRSTDSGATWEHILGGLPGRSINALDYDSYGRRLLATAGSGQLFESRDSGASWKKIDSGWTIRSVSSFKGKLLALTAFDGLIMKRESEIDGINERSVRTF